MQKTKHDNKDSHARRGLKDAQVRPPPADYYAEEDSNNSTTSARSHHHDKTKVRSAEVEFESVESRSASSTSSAEVKSKFVKSTDRPSRHHGSFEDSSSVSTKSRLRATDTPRRPLSINREDLPTSALEHKLRVVESGNPFEDEEYDSLSVAKPSTTTYKKGQAKSFGQQQQGYHEDKKRWVWATQILQDDTPVASGVPPPGQNANLLNSIPVNTPAANLVAPSFPPIAPVVKAETPISSGSSSLTTPPASTSSRAARQPIVNRKKPAAAPATVPVAREKRWTWGTSIIQDGSEDAPPVGQNANLLSSGTTIALNTPVVQLTPPSFPPRPEPTQLESNGGAQAAAQVVESASSTLSAVASAMTLPVVETSPAQASNIEALLAKLQEQIDALASAYSQASATAEAVDAAAQTSPADNAKRWVWGPSIIQDDTPSSEAPPIGQNTNLFNPSLPVATPTGKPLAPNYKGHVGLASIAVPVSVDAPGVAAAKEPAAPVTSPAVDPVVAAVPDAVSTSSSSVHRNRKSEADSIRSVRAAASKTAALEWHLANQKRKIGGMSKQHKK